MSHRPAPGRATGPLKVLVGCASLVLSLGLVELAARVLQPRLERTQLVRPSEDTAVESLDGVPVWYSRADSPPRWQLACAEQRDSGSVVALGSSILAAVGMDLDQAWSTLLQQRLDADPPGQAPAPCVHNLAETAFGHHQKAAVARKRLPSLHPAVVLWEVWGTDTADYRWIGGSALRVADLELDASGLPNPWHLPPAANRWLLAHSQAWLLASVRATPRAEQPRHGLDVDQLYRDEMPALHRLVAGLGAELVLVTAPPLHRSFADSAADPSQLDRRAAAFAARYPDVHLLSLAEELQEDSVEELRLDPCCHYNAAGNQRLAEVFEERLRALLEAGG